jgi:dihydroxyacetone kinase-like protein
MYSETTGGFSAMLRRWLLRPFRAGARYYSVTQGGARKASLALGWLVFGLWPTCFRLAGLRRRVHRSSQDADDEEEEKKARRCRRIYGCARRWFRSRLSGMKKLINSAESVVSEALQGMAAAHPDLLRVHFDPNFITRADAPVKGKVALISGGGSGHEPMHGGFVGRGMLDAACPGAVFTSPTPDQMLAATKAVAGEKGALLIVKNYTGDVMNFEMAAELLRAEGIPIESVIIDDDVAVQDSTWTAGRRGVGATVLAEKICGAAAEAGQPLNEVAALCRRINAQARSMGMALTSCTVPHIGRPTFDLPEDEMEIGVGIHGEPGRRRVKLAPADEIVELLVEPILQDLPFRAGDEVLLFVNGLGGTPLLELYIVYRKAAELLEQAGIRVTRNLVGSYITSLEMAGTAITLLKLDPELTKLWDAPALTPALRKGL